MELAKTVQQREQGGAGAWRVGDIWEWENGKQIRPGKGHGVLLHSGGEQDRLKKRVVGKTTPLLLLSPVCKRQHCLRKGFLQMIYGLRHTETAK